MKLILLCTFCSIIALYLIICSIVYAYQERLIFFPQKLPPDYQFLFEQNFEEVIISTEDHTKLHGILFKAKHSRGLLFYLHGNAGSLSSWGEIAKTYTDLQYDIFILDYRGYGKSEGAIKSEKQFYQDVQCSYNVMKARYPEDSITIIGYSIGTGAAAMLASTNKPHMLLLQAPYYSLRDMASHTYPFLPTTLLKYKFETYKFIPQIKAPVILFHGNADEVIYYGSSLKLQPLLKPTDTFITLEGEGHNGITQNAQYLQAIRSILTQ